MDTVMIGLEILRRALSRIGPYLVLEILVPGGTLLALLLYLARWRRGSVVSHSGNTLVRLFFWRVSK